MIEKFAVSALSTRTASFQEDLAVRVEAGVGGIGLWEAKLSGISIPAATAAFHQSGLRATLCLPAVASILPTSETDEPSRPSERVAAMCSGACRFAPFSPVAVVCESGPPGSLSDEKAQGIVIRGLRQIARTVALASHRPMLIGLEPSAADDGARSVATSLSAAVDLIEEVGEKNVGLVLDTWQLAESSTLLEESRRFVDRIIGVQISYRRDLPRSHCDRVLPKDGLIELDAIIATLEEAGYRGWYELEICSDDGTFGDDFADSLWKLAPVELTSRGRQRFLEIWMSARARTTA